MNYPIVVGEKACDLEVENARYICQGNLAFDSVRIQRFPCDGSIVGGKRPQRDLRHVPVQGARPVLEMRLLPDHQSPAFLRKLPGSTFQME
jgi:hypothetical protein